MKIIEFQAENVKRIKAISIKPSGAIVEITGENGAGKSSILDAIFWCLADAKNIQDVPVRKGADRALIKIDLGEFVVTRIIRQKEGGDFTHSLKVENKDGFQSKSPQALLDAMVGKLSFDPFEFTRMKPDAQFDACRAFVPDFDFDANAKGRKEAFEERTAINRRAKDLRAQADGVTFETVAGKPVDEADLVAQLEQAGQHNADIERRRANRETAQVDIAARREAAARARAEAVKLREQADAKDRDAASQEEQADHVEAQIAAAGDLPAPIDTTILRGEIEQARTHNAKITRATEAARQKADLEKKAKAAETEAETLTKKLAEFDKAKAGAIAKAKLPVAGLTFGDGVVLLDDLPLNQASGAMQLRVSCAVAAALNPKLRVLRVKDGALLDAKSMSLLAEFAEQHDMQVWIESVDSRRPGAIVIEDGMVAEPSSQVAAE